MIRRKVGDEFKRHAVAQITERGCPVRKVSERLGVGLYSLYAWKRSLRRRHQAGRRRTPRPIPICWAACG